MKGTAVRDRTKQDEIAAGIRTRIIQGLYPPGSRIPTRTEIEKAFHVSTVTVQRALTRLIKEGFLVARNQHGTFVTDYPPHLSHYAVLMPYPPSRTWSQYWQAIYEEARNVDQGDVRRRVEVFHGFPDITDLASHKRLIELVQNERLAGLIFALNPRSITGTPLIDKPGLPRVAITDSVPPCRFPVVAEDIRSFLHKSLRYLSGRGRRRVAFLCSGHVYAWYPIADALGAYGMTTRPYWVQIVTFAAAPYAQECVHLLMHPGQDERPDALIVGDDNLLEPATKGLLDAGVNVPAEMDVVALTNFPHPTNAAVPVKRLGFSMTDIMRLCIESIDAQRRGESPPPVTFVPAIFDHELDPSSGRPLDRASVERRAFQSRTPL